jgi:hypothetical protein
MAALTTYKLWFMRANNFWKAPGVYFYMHQTSSPYHIGFCWWDLDLGTSVGDTLLAKLPISDFPEESTPTHNQISGPITQASAHQLNNQVSSFLASYSSYLDNGNMCSVLLPRNDGQEQNGVAFTLVTFGFQNSSSSWWPPWPHMVSIKWYPERGWSVRDFLFYRKKFSYCPKNPKKW